MKSFVAAICVLATMISIACAANITICESVPRQMDIDVELTTTQAWLRLLDSATQSVDIAQYYWTLSEGKELQSEYGGEEGMMIYNKLIEIAKRGVKIRIVQNQPESAFPQTDTQRLAELGVAEVRSIDFSKFGNKQIQSGILHTKLLISDSDDVYIGSANADWRSLTQVKELGILVNDPVIAKDTRRLFQQYWDVSESNNFPDEWTTEYDAIMNIENPLYRQFDGDDDISLFYTSSSPEPFCSVGRTYALDALVDLIKNAKKQVNIEVMDYVPASVYMEEKFYWDEIDRALRDANFRGVQVRFLAGKWNHTKSYAVQYLKSLDVLDNVEVRWYSCPDMVGFDAIPYTRVNHAKFVGTENGAFVSNNNWSADYFLSTAGLSSVIKGSSFANKINSVFERDWNSKYATKL